MDFQFEDKPETVGFAHDTEVPFQLFLSPELHMAMGKPEQIKVTVEPWPLK